MVFIVLSHTHPELVERLVAKLLAGDPECHVIVEHDAGGPSLPMGSSGRLHVRTSDRSGGWGGFGLVETVLGALRHACERLEPGWVVLLSGQDYPAVSSGEIRRRLEASGQDAFLDLWREVDPDDGDGADAWYRARYFRRWYRVPGLPKELGRRRAALQRRLSFAQPLVFVWTLPRGAGTRVGFKRRRTPFGEDFTCRMGSQWFALGQAAQASLLDQLRRRPELIDYYRRTVIPDESFFVTLVANDPALRVSGENLTFVRMEDAGGAHAGVLEVEDLPEIEASGRLLVRKVEPGRSTTLMDALDQRVGAA